MKLLLKMTLLSVPIFDMIGEERSLMRKYFIFTSLILLLVSGAFAAPLRFAIIGDRAGGVNQKAFDTVIDDIVRLRPDFVLTVGDISDNALEAEWDRALESLSRISVPVYYVPGNNDIVDDTTRNLFTQKTGFPPFYSFDKGQVHFIVLDNSCVEKAGDMGKEQLSWLEKDLKKKRKAETTLVFMHKPFWADGIARNEEDPLHTLFIQYGVDAVFTGHWHQYAHNVFDSVDYYLVGSSGGSFPFEEETLGMFYQFLWCTLDTQGLHTALLKAGSTFPEDLMTIQEEQAVFTLTAGAGAVFTDQTRGEVLFPGAAREESTVKLKLNAVENWEASLPGSVTVQPLQETRIPFSLIQKGDFFPHPSLTVDYPLGRGKIVPLSLTLSPPRILAAGRGSVPPLLDGKLDEEAWEETQQVSDFCDLSGRPVDNLGMSVRFYRTDEALFIGARIPRNSLVKSRLTERDSAVYQEDALGILLSSDSRHIFQLYISSLGTLWDTRFDVKAGSSDTDWDGEWTAAASQENDSWTLEVRIPYTLLETDAASSIFCNIRRKGEEGGNLLLTPAWNLAPRGYSRIEP